MAPYSARTEDQRVRIGQRQAAATLDPPQQRGAGAAVRSNSRAENDDEVVRQSARPSLEFGRRMNPADEAG